MNVSENNLIHPSQTHSSNVVLADKTIKDYPDTDGLIVNSSGIAVFLNFADCTPLIFYDEKHITPIISMIKSLDIKYIRNSLDNVLSLVLFKTVSESFAEYIDAKIKDLCLFSFFDYILLLENEYDFLCASDIVKQITNLDVTAHKILNLLPDMRSDVISLAHKQKLIKIIYNLK